VGNYVIITISLAVLCAATRTDLTPIRQPNVALLAVALGLLAGGCILFYYFALSKLEIWKVSVMQLLIPVTSALFQNLILAEPVTAPQIAGMALIMAGAAVLIFVHQRHLANARATG